METPIVPNTSNPIPKKSFSWIFAILVLILISISGWFYYQNLQLKAQLASTTNLLNQSKKVFPKAQLPNPTDSKRELNRRCGDFLDSVKINSDKFEVLSGPLWSPDCRYIAWGFWMSGTSWLGDESPRPSPLDTPHPSEGIFLYNDRTRQVSIVYKPKHSGETPELVNWSSSDELIFKTQSGSYTYNVTLKTTSEQQ
ncbi:MAG: hypothetical protein AAB430_03320 [Patescibacteria group bacterium]